MSLTLKTAVELGFNARIEPTDDAKEPPHVKFIQRIGWYRESCEALLKSSLGSDVNIELTTFDGSAYTSFKPVAIEETTVKIPFCYRYDSGLAVYFRKPLWLVLDAAAAICLEIQKEETAARNAFALLATFSLPFLIAAKQCSPFSPDIEPASMDDIWNALSEPSRYVRLSAPPTHSYQQFVRVTNADEIAKFLFSHQGIVQFNENIETLKIALAEYWKASGFYSSV